MRSIINLKFAGILVLLLIVVNGCDSRSVFELRAGDCFNDWRGADKSASAEIADVAVVDVVDCTDPHDNEVYLIGQLEDGNYPVRPTIADAAFDACLEEFDSFAGVAYSNSLLEVGALWPTQKSWLSGDRAVTCFVYDIRLEKLTGSMQGAAV